MFLRIQTHQVHSFLSTDCNVFTSYLNLESLGKRKWWRSWVNFVITLRLSSKLFIQKYCCNPRGYILIAYRYSRFLRWYYLSWTKVVAPENLAVYYSLHLGNKICVGLLQPYLAGKAAIKFVEKIQTRVQIPNLMVESWSTYFRFRPEDMLVAENLSIAQISNKRYCHPHLKFVVFVLFHHSVYNSMTITTTKSMSKIFRQGDGGGDGTDINILCPFFLSVQTTFASLGKFFPIFSQLIIQKNFLSCLTAPFFTSLRWRILSKAFWESS